MIDIRIEDFNYTLPDERIAKYPLAQRDASKLLRYRSGEIDEFVFRDLPDLIPSDAIMVFNDTKVVPARLFFRRATGAHIEIFCLEPVDPPQLMDEHEHGHDEDGNRPACPAPKAGEEGDNQRNGRFDFCYFVWCVHVCVPPVFYYVSC